MKKKQLIIAGAVVLAAAAGAAAVYAQLGYKYGFGPMRELHKIKLARHPGNAPEYAPASLDPAPDSPLKGKTILFLGSSVTYGSATGGTSFAEMLGAVTGCEVVKEAVSGTTLAGEDASTYVSRLEALELEKVDMLVVQLSTNDATRKLPLGEVLTDGSSDYDRNTVAGAIERIINYADAKWACPVYFYTSPRYDSAEYEAMVGLMPALRAKWGIGVIDLWADEALDAEFKEDAKLLMADPIHPTLAGYRKWLPKFEAALEDHWRF